MPGLSSFFAPASVGAHLPMGHDPVWATLSVFLSIATSYAAIRMAASACQMRDSWGHWVWMAAGAMAMGGGVWAMHFVGMIAMTLPVPVTYAPGVTALSVVPAVAASFLAIRMVCRDTLTGYTLAGAAVLMGGGIGVMHYTGMMGMRLNATMAHDPNLFALSIVVAVVLAGVSLRAMLWARETVGIYGESRRVVAAVVMGAAISTMHYTGMAAVMFYPGPYTAGGVEGVDNSVLGSAIVVMSVVITALALVATMVETAFRRVRESERRYQSVVELSPAMICTLDDGKITYVNSAGVRMLGASRPERVLGRPLSDFTHPDYAAIFDDDESLRELVDSGQRVPLIMMGLGIPPVEGDMAIGSISVANKEIFVVEIADITERKDNAQALLGREQRLQGVLNNAADAIVTLDADGLIRSFNRAATVIFGHHEEAVLGRQLRDVIGCASSDLQAGERELAALRADGAMVPIDLSVAEMHTADGPISIVIARDITNRKAQALELQHMANHDAVTGLPNRRAVQEALDAQMEDGGSGAVFFISLQGHRSFIDALGHHMGEKLVRVVAGALSASRRGGDALGRWGDGEFVISTTDAATPAMIEAYASEIQDVLSQPFMVEGHEVVLSCFIGTARFPLNGKTPDALIRNAGLAMFSGRMEGAWPHWPYSEEIDKKVAERHELEQALRGALSRDEIEVFYQPKIDMKNKCIYGMEALVRWRHPDFGLVSPVQFIPIAEDTGMIVDIGRWVLEQSCRQTQSWREDGHDLVVAVNLSGRQFEEKTLVDDVRAILAQTGLPAQNLELEVTESCLVDDVDQALAILSELKGLGIKIAIDDFGTGYSSLAYLKQFPMDTLKIDQSFVRNLPDDEGDKAITSTIVSMARSLKLGVVAEGIETDEHHHFLSELGCDLGQGYLFSKPLPGAEFGAYLQALNDPSHAEPEPPKSATVTPLRGEVGK